MDDRPADGQQGMRRSGQVDKESTKMSRASPRFRRNNPQLPTATGAVYQLVTSGLIDGQRWVIDLGLMANSLTQTSISEQNIAASWLANAAYTDLKNIIASDVTIDTIKVVCVSVTNRQPYVTTPGAAGGAGTVVGGHYNSELAGIISKYTPTKGQHGRGRNYYPGVPISFVTTGAGADCNHLNNTGATPYAALASALAAMSLADGANTAALAVYTRPGKGLPVTQAQVCSRVVAQTLLGTVRRRRIGRGK